MKKRTVRLFCCTMLPLSALAQTPVGQQHCDAPATRPVFPGVRGAALNLSRTAAVRAPVTWLNALEGPAAGYSVSCRVKAEPSGARYTIREATSVTDG